MAGVDDQEDGENIELNPDGDGKDGVVAKNITGDQICDNIGTIGRWQIEKMLLCFCLALPGLMHIFVSAFVAPKTDFWCMNNGTNISDVNVCVDGCLEYKHDITSNGGEFWESTIVTDFDLVCSSIDIPVMFKMLFFSGFAAGTILAGILSDMWGRKRSIFIFSMVLLVSGLVTSFTPNMYAFIVCWWVVGVAAISSFTVAFVWLAELSSGKWKVILSMFAQFGWPISRWIMVLIAWYLPNWRRMLQVTSAPCILAPFLLYFLPESPRWLLAQGRLDEAKAVLVSAAKRNNITLDPNLTLKTTEQKAKGTVWDIMKYPTLRIKTFIMYWNWFSSSFILYGLALNWGSMTGSLFKSFLMASILDLPAKAIALLLPMKFGCRLPYILLSTASGILFVIASCLHPFFPNELPVLIVMLCGSFGISASFAMLWLYMAELMPTTVRNAGVGSSSMVARFGGILGVTMGVLADISPVIPTALFAGTSLISAFISLFLPETKGKPMPDTPEESENIKLVKFWKKSN